MKIKCNNCNVTYKIDDTKIKTNTITTRCPRCRHVQTSEQENENKYEDPFSVELSEELMEKRTKEIVEEETGSFGEVFQKQKVKKTKKAPANVKAKNLKNNSNKGATKLLFFSLTTLFLVVFLALVVFLISKYFIKKNVEDHKQNNKNLIIEKYVTKWKKTIITSPQPIESLYSKARNYLCKDDELLYPVSTSLFRELFLKDKNNTNFLYYSILSETISPDVHISEKRLQKYLLDLQELEKTEKNSVLLATLSGIYFRLNDFISSYNYSEKSLKLDNKNEFALFLKAKFYLKNSKVKKAISYLDRAIKINPNLNIARQLLSKTFVKNSLFKEGIEYYSKEDSTLAKYSKAELFLNLGMYNKAASILKKLDSPKSIILYSKILYQLLDERKSALKLLENTKKNELSDLSLSDKIELYSQLMNLYYLNSNKTKFIKSSNKLKDLDNNSKFYNFSMALLQIREANFKEVEFFVSKLSKNSELYNFIKLEYFLEKKDYDKALKYSNKLIEAYPYKTQYWMNKILLACKLNNLELVNTTITALSGVVEPSYYVRNKNYFKYFKIDKDFSEIQSYLIDKLNTNNVSKEIIYKNLGIFEFYRHNYSKSIKFFNESNSIVTNNHINYLYLGNIYFSKGDFEEAVKNATLSIKLNRFNIFSYLLTVRSYLKLNQIKPAKKYYQMAEDNTDKREYLTLIKIFILVKENKLEKAKELLKVLGSVFDSDYLVRQLKYKL